MAHENHKNERNFDAQMADGRVMNPAKPAAHTQVQPPAHAPAGPVHHAKLPAKGLPFACILATQARPPKSPELPTTHPAGTSQPALPQAVQALSAEPEKRHHHHGHDDELDPSARQAAQLAPRVGLSPRTETSQEAPLTNARVSLEDLVPQLVKKIAWSGDAKAGTVRMELGAGELAGATLTVSAEHGRVSVQVDTPPGTDTAAWRERLASRLTAKGIPLDAVEVR